MCIRDRNREELRFMFAEFREEDKRTKTGMNKRWEETSYPVDRLQETVISDFKQLNETLDSTSKSIKETLNENMEPGNQKITQKEMVKELEERHQELQIGVNSLSLIHI